MTGAADVADEAALAGLLEPVETAVLADGLGRPVVADVVDVAEIDVIDAQQREALVE